jgi:hypothetical protein
MTEVDDRIHNKNHWVSSNPPPPGVRVFSGWRFLFELAQVFGKSKIGYKDLHEFNRFFAFLLHFDQKQNKL